MFYFNKLSKISIKAISLRFTLNDKNGTIFMTYTQHKNVANSMITEWKPIKIKQHCVLNCIQVFTMTTINYGKWCNKINRYQRTRNSNLGSLSSGCYTIYMNCFGQFGLEYKTKNNHKNCHFLTLPFPCKVLNI